ncbi:hypothetical protein [Stenotrophomonas terrae]|uniref:hypothetical protein n=1 Tax=Stenotrophomonas terrae TaxID=405446 RepID=UPI00070D4F99|nr:hypothetical protein [Stenotrophomonas terrae]
MVEGAVETLGFREFATHMGWRPGYVTELRKAGRLVLSEDGRRVLVQASINRINGTRDPSREGVRERHAAARAAQAGELGVLGARDIHGGTSGARVAAGAAGADDEPDDDIGASINSPHQLRRAKALADKEEANARKVLREEAQEMGQLLVRDEVVAVVAEAVVELRRKLELLPTTIAAALAATDSEEDVRALLRDNIEAALDAASKKFYALGRKA